MPCSALVELAATRDIMWTTSHRHLLMLTVCVTNFGAEPASAGPTVTPHWVRQRPHLPGFIIGIGSAAVGKSTTAGPNRALLLALHDIAAQLDVRLLSEASLHRGETADGLDERFAQRVDLRSDLALEGVEVVDTWTRADTCWVYARLERGAFQRRQHAAPARALAAGVSALELMALSAATPEDEVVEALRLRLADMRLVPNAESSAVLPAGTGEIVSVRLAADCGDDVDAASCGAGVPVRWRLARGAGELTPLSWTDDDGRASTRMTRLDATVSQPVVTAAIDLAAFHHRPEVAVELNRLPVPAATLVIPQPPPLSAQVSLVATAAGLANVISTKLGTRGIDIVEAGGDLSVQVQAELQRQHDVGSICFAVIEVTITVDDGDGVHLFHSGLSELKGSGRTGREAVRSAFEEADSLFDEAVTQSRRQLLETHN